MGLDKYKFVPGEKYPAENASSIDPDNIQPLSAGYLTGGNNVSALSVFQSLGIGANDGKFKMNIDGNVYDDVYLNFNKSQGVEEVVVSANPASSNTTNISGQSFNSNVVSKIKSITISAASAWQGGTRTLTLREGKNAGGTILGTATATGGGNRNLTFTFPTPIELQKGQSYSFFWDGYQYIYYNTGNAPDTSVDDYYMAGSFQDGYVNFSITGDKWFELSNFDDLATLLQFVIREETSSTEAVEYDTDHFVITSATANRDSKILKLMTPSSGTDISGAGATPYLDCAENATEVLGTGEDYNLVRLNENGKLPIEISSPIRAIASDTLRASADTERSRGYTETTPTKMKEISTEYGGIIRVKFEGKGQSSDLQHAQIYKNGVAFGTLRTFTDATYREYSEDLLFEKGDLIQLYLWVSFSNSSYRAYCKNFRVYFDLQKGNETNINLD